MNVIQGFENFRQTIEQEKLKRNSILFANRLQISAVILKSTDLIMKFREIYIHSQGFVVTLLQSINVVSHGDVDVD